MTTGSNEELRMLASKIHAAINSDSCGFQYNLKSCQICKEIVALLEAALPKSSPAPRNCPTCNSPQPQLHPAMQFEGEVQPCKDLWHNRPAWGLPAKSSPDALRMGQEGRDLCDRFALILAQAGVRVNDNMTQEFEWIHKTKAALAAPSSPIEGLREQARIDVVNLNFYADLAREQRWQTDVIGCGVIEVTLREIAKRLAALAPQVGPVSPEEENNG